MSLCCSIHDFFFTPSVQSLLIFHHHFFHNQNTGCVLDETKKRNDRYSGWLICSLEFKGSIRCSTKQTKKKQHKYQSNGGKLRAGAAEPGGVYPENKPTDPESDLLSAS